MSDDIWRDRRDDDDFSEFGSLFDDAEPTASLPEVDNAGYGDAVAESEAPARSGRESGHDDGAVAAERDDDRLSFGDSGTGPMPHWTEPPTGEVPRLDAERVRTGDDPITGADEDVDVWSSFSSEAPVWADDAPAEPDPAPESRRSTGEQAATSRRRVTDSGDVTDSAGMPATSRLAEVPGRTGSGPVSGRQRRVTGESELVQREPSRITIGTDPSGMPRRQPPSSRRGKAPGRPSRPGRAGRPGPRPALGGEPAASSGRDMPMAIAVGLGIAAAFIAAMMYSPLVTAILVAVVLGLGAVEFYDKVSERGYRPAIVPGIVACIAAPAAAYWLGDATLPLAMAFAFMATAASFIGARSVDSGPMPNISITTLGIVWIGLLGSFAMLILRLSTRDVSALEEIQSLAEHRGTDTLLLLAIGVVANDVGAFFIGSAIGKTPLRSWISPNKTVEGLIGGAGFTIVALQFVGLTDRSTTWVSSWHLLLLALVIAVIAPLGDLVESMFKRNLDVKDFGSLVKGHGGILDRFDGFLFVLPAVYYLTLVLEPWTKYVPT